MTFEADPSAQPELVRMWRSAINKAHQEIPPPRVLTTSLVMNFDGAGLPLTAGMAGSCPVIFPCRIIGCHLLAGTWNISTGFQPGSVTATVDLRLANRGAWTGGTLPLVDSLPALVAQPESSPSVAGWPVTDLQPGDVIPYALATFTGSATFLTVSIDVRRLDARGIGVSSVTDDTDVVFTDGAGAPFTIRG